MEKATLLFFTLAIVIATAFANPYIEVSADEEFVSFNRRGVYGGRDMKPRWRDLSRYGDDDALDGEAAKEADAYPPPNPAALNETNVGAACPCKKILISSLGDAQHIQSKSMGTYTRYSSYNGKDSYSGPGSNRMYFLNSGWLVGPSIGSGVGYIHNSQLYACPYLIPGGWMYVNNGYWYNDATLVVRCIQ